MACWCRACARARAIVLILITMVPTRAVVRSCTGDGSYDHEQELRGHLSGCGINAELQIVPSRGLSGGQRSRVAMAAVSRARAHVRRRHEPHATATPKPRHACMGTMTAIRIEQPIA